MKLTVKGVQGIAYEGRARKLFDGGGLHLHVTARARTWRYAFRLDGRERTYTIGAFPDVSLQEARARHREARELVAVGRDPVETRRDERAARVLERAVRARQAHTAGDVVDEWFEAKGRDGWSAAHADKVRIRLERNVDQAFRGRRASDATPEHVQRVLDVIVARSRITTAHTVRAYLREAFNRAVAHELLETNPVTHPRVSLPKKPTVRAFGHTTRVATLGHIVRAIDVYHGDPTTAAALGVLAHAFCRPTELRLARWREFEETDQVWRIPAERMKMNREHWIPLSTPVLDRLAEQRRRTGGRPDGLVFPSRIGEQPLSNNTLNRALRLMGFDRDTITSHGFRHTASSLLNAGAVTDTDGRRFPADVIERALSHTDRSVRGVYNRADYWPERVAMAEAWSRLLVSLSTPATVTSIATARA